MDAYIVTVHLTSPVIMNHITPLDAVIAGIMTSGKQQSSLDLSMFDHHQMIPMASYPFFDINENGEESYDSFPTQMRGNIMNAIQRSPLAKERLDPTSPEMRKGDISTNYTYWRGTVQRTIQTNSISWYMTGNAEDVAKYLAYDGAIGAQRGKGYGAIDPLLGVTIEPVSGELIGILTPKGTLARPIPANMGRTLGLDGYETAGRSTAPYNPRLVREMNLSFEEVMKPIGHID